MGKVFKVSIKTPTEHSHYDVGEEEKDYLVKVFENLEGCSVEAKEWETED